MTTLERDVEQALRRVVEKHGGLCLKWVCPGWAGVPDRIILLPGGRVMFVETKRPKGGKVSPLQRKWAEKLQRLGFFYKFVWTKEDIKLLELIVLDKLTRGEVVE